jgi:hypothetical protein
VGEVSGLLGRIGTWTAARSYWTLFAVASAIVLLKSGFKWAGTTGEGWFIEFRDVIDAWPLKELLVRNDSAWQENWSPIAAFKVLTKVGFPYSSVTWNLIHIGASVAAIVLIGVWARRTYGDQLGRLVAILILFGAVPIVLLQEIGRYDSFFFLGAVMVAVGRRWWVIVPGALLIGASSWTMSMGVAGSLVLVALVLRSRSLAVRGALIVLGCIAGALILMGLRVSQGGDPWLVRLGNVGTGAGGKNLTNMVYQAWNNLFEPFPNWIFAAFGVTWILVGLVLIQARRRRIVLGVAIVILPLLAAALNSGDGTREIALAFTAALLATANELQRRAVASGSSDGVLPTLSPVALGLVVVIALAAPVVDINPSVPLNTYQWLSDYGLSIVYNILGP